MVDASDDCSRRHSNPKSNMMKSIALSVLFFLSLFTHFDFQSTSQQDIFETNAMNAGESTGYHSSSPILLSDSTNVSFIQGEQPYRWFSIEGHQGPTYINITANTSTSDYYSQGMAKGYTAYDQCISSWFTVGYGVSSMCSNPSGDPTILFSISFLNSADGSSRLSENLTLEISIGEYVAPAPPIVTAYPYPDGDTNADSDSGSSPLVELTDSGSYGSVQGYFESQYDEDRITFKSQFSGTHRLNLTFNTPVDANPLLSGDLSQCVESDNTGLQKVLHYTDGDRFTSVGDKVFFRASDGISGSELWISDGTNPGTTMVKDIYDGYSSGNPQGLTAVGNILYFVANDGSNGFELWKSDGTASGTMMVMDIRSGSLSSYPQELTAIGNTLYFSVDDGTNGYELWRSDGTTSGTMMVKDIYNGYSSSSPQGLTAVGDTLYFRADDGINGNELWKSDGTASGTVMVKDINSGGGSGSPIELTAIGSTLYFRANDGTNGYELWKSDGTNSGTVLVNDIYNGYSSSYPYQLTAFGNTLYFSANDGTNGYELWKSDGTNSGTVMVKDIYNDYSSSNPAYLTAVGDTLYFQADDGANGNELWKSDGTEAGTVMVRDLRRGSGSSNPLELTPISEVLYFKADGAWYSYSKTMATTYEGYFDCLIIADPGEGFRVGFDSSEPDSSAYPIQWSVSTKVEQVYPFEDPQRGDSEAFSALPPLLQHNDTIAGVYNFYYDQDDYSIAIDHGTMQHLVVTTDTPTEIRFYHHSCGREGEGTFSSMGFSQNVQLDTSVSSHSFWCDTRYIADEVKFSLKYIGPDGNTAFVPSPNSYTVDAFTTPLNSTFEPTIDSPARGVVPTLSYPEIYEGSFRHWSDQTDGYRIITAPGENVLVNLSSNCATLMTSKSQYYESQSVSPYSMLWQGTVPNGSNVYTFEVNRVGVNSIHDVELKDTCGYTIETSINTVQQFVHYTEYFFSNTENRLSPSSPIVIDNFSSYLPENTTTETYKVSIPFDVLPSVDGYIEATQSSGEVPIVKLSGTHTRTNSGTKHMVGQHIEVTGQRVQWNHITVSNLDGSELSLSFTEQPLSMLTMEGNELFSRASGALGVSRDEGWDPSDTWYLNTSGTTATHASVRLSLLTNGLSATLSDEENGAISQFVCLNGASNSVSVYHQNGSGEYELEVIYGYGNCPNLNYDAPAEVPTKSSFEVSSYASGVGSYTWQIYDLELNQIYQGSDSSEVQVISLPESILDGSYRLLMTDESGLTYLDRPLAVTSTPIHSVQPTNAHLAAMETPKIEIQSIMPHSGKPIPWTFSNVTIRSISDSGQVRIQSLDEEFTGLGSKVLEIDELSNTMAGSRIFLQGDLISGLEKSTHIVYWARTFYSPQIECEGQITPDYFNPENDVLCLVLLDRTTHGSPSQSLGPAEYQVEGLIEVYDNDMNRLSQTKFTNDLLRPTPVRINAVDLGPGDYHVKLNSSITKGIYLKEGVGQFSVGDYINSGQTDEVAGEFDFNLISVRDTAAAGDDILLAWSTSGGVSQYFFVEVFAENELVDSYYILNDESVEGQFNVKLPTDWNPYKGHSIQITAFDNLMASVSDAVYLEGKSQQVYLEVNVNPDRPVVGSMVEVNLIISTDDDWLAWSWALLSSFSSSSNVLASGSGFAESNKDSFEFELPLSQYTSTPYLHLTAESEDGTLYSEIIPIEPVPLRSVNIDVDTNMVIGKDYNVEWEVGGKYLNSVDDVERIEFVIFTMDYERYHEEVFFVASDSGEFSVLAPNSLNPGSHRIVVSFTFTDGETYEHSQIITVQSTPDGITLLGVTIPPLAMGFDTLIVSALIIHAVFLHRRGSKTKSEDDFEDDQWEHGHDEFDDSEAESNVETDHEEEALGHEPQEESEHMAGVEDDQYPMYQEYPIGSGNHWVRYAEDLEWELTEL